ncbi:A disintegrin and metalloproteinase with thrombospondin motifs 7, partial [Frankliniella fusca]
MTRTPLILAALLALPALLLTRAALPEDLSEDQSRLPHGLFSGAVPGRRLVYPRKVAVALQPGDFHDGGLQHFHGEHHRHRRARRLSWDWDWARAPPSHIQAADASTAGAPPAVQYEVALPAEASASRLLLWPSTAFLAPALRIDSAGAGAGAGVAPRRRRRSASRSRRSVTSCHYRGVVQGDPGSSVALSACGQGLVGLVKTSKAEYWLEPTAGDTAPGAHVLFQRHKGWLKGGGGGRRRGWGRGRGKGKGKGKRKGKGRGRKGRRRRHDKNCGTRDPVRSNETVLAWGRGRPGLSVQQKGGAGPGRAPRSVSTEKHVEVLLVADQSMTAFHQDGDIETYLLTIMNMVASMYHDPTIGNLINIVVVRIILMDEWASESEGETFNSTVNADATLASFCRWASQLNPPDEADPHHHDVAVLVTRVDICARRDTPCNTLGVAHVGGMCSAARACSVTQDNGVVLAHTIAHELGHNLGMTHDTENLGCPRKVDGVLHVMTPTFEADNHRMAWSPCSRRSVTAFLDDGKGACLDDAPTLGGYQYPDMPAGSMYGAEHQCRLQFGTEEARVCSELEEVCTRLWCEVDGQCTTLLQPAAPGTMCGKHKWCQDQQCTEMSELPEPVPGGWSSWGEWGPCSRTCGAGVSTMERRCDHPAPRHGGAYCLGERRRYRVCNTQPCPEGAPSFRAAQCAAYNNRTYLGANYTWLPYFDAAEPCELYCADADDTVIVPWGGAVQDGTPCNLGRRDMCIGRVCRKVGCDWTVDSDAVEDRCGVCRGDGSLCDTVTGTYSRPDGYGYIEAFQIPTGARNVIIVEEAASKNFIGIGSVRKPVFYLNGRRKITLPGEYDVGGTAALYERVGDLETVRIPGPLRDNILVYVIFRGRARNPGVRYQYTVRRPGAVPPAPAWRWADWSECSATCGGGRQEMRAVCAAGVQEGGGSGLNVVQDSECELTVGPRPPDKNRECAMHACPATWWTGPWQVCSATCGEAAARGAPPPAAPPPGRALTPSCSCRRWWTGPWQVCSATCGEAAARRRSVLCVVRGRQELALPDAECDQATRPAEQERCREVPPCPTPASHAPAAASPPPPPPAPDDGSAPAADLFAVELSRPSSRQVDDVLEVDGGLDLDNLSQDERDFLVNYTTFFRDHNQQGSNDLGVVGQSMPPLSSSAADKPASPGRSMPAVAPGAHGAGVWEDDMDLPPRAPRRHPLVRLHPQRAAPAPAP